MSRSLVELMRDAARDAGSDALREMFVGLMSASLLVSPRLSVIDGDLRTITAFAERAGADAAGVDDAVTMTGRQLFERVAAEDRIAAVVVHASGCRPLRLYRPLIEILATGGIPQTLSDHQIEYTPAAPLRVLTRPLRGPLPEPLVEAIELASRNADVNAIYVCEMKHGSRTGYMMTLDVGHTATVAAVNTAIDRCLRQLSSAIVVLVPLAGNQPRKEPPVWIRSPSRLS